MHDDGEHLILVLIVHCMSSPVKCLFKSFAHFVNWVICPLVGFLGPVLDTIFVLVSACEYFLSICGFPFHLLDSILE